MTKSTCMRSFPGGGRRIVVAACLLLLLLLMGASACAPAQSGGGSDLALVAYSTPREAYAELIKAFQATPAGAGVSFEQSYAGSTELSLAVRNGLPADIVALSLEPDVASLVDAGLVQPNWNQTRTRGMVTRSVVVLVVRKGNPRGIMDWADLIKPGVEVVTPNPFTSGGAQWDIAAAYGSQLRSGKSTEQAADYLRQLFAHVPVQGKSAREALQAFVGGAGDALISYENEAIQAKQQGEPIEYVIPDSTILIENPLAFTIDGRSSPHAQAFVDFLLGPEGQSIFSKAGYRPVAPEVTAGFTYPQPSGLFSIADLGDWPSIRAKLFDRQVGLAATLFATQGMSPNGN
jgi:sulfate transport system substrate-binding protein